MTRLVPSTSCSSPRHDTATAKPTPPARRPSFQKRRKSDAASTPAIGNRRSKGTSLRPDQSDGEEDSYGELLLSEELQKIQQTQREWQKEMEKIRQEHQLAAHALARKGSLLKKSLKSAVEQVLTLEESKTVETSRTEQEMEALRQENEALRSSLRLAMEHNKKLERKDYVDPSTNSSHGDGMEVCSTEPATRSSIEKDPEDQQVGSAVESNQLAHQDSTELIAQWEQKAEALERIVSRLEEDKTRLEVENENLRAELQAKPKKVDGETMPRRWSSLLNISFSDRSIPEEDTMENRSSSLDRLSISERNEDEEMNENESSQAPADTRSSTRSMEEDTARREKQDHPMVKENHQRWEQRRQSMINQGKDPSRRERMNRRESVQDLALLSATMKKATQKRSSSWESWLPDLDDAV